MGEPADRDRPRPVAAGTLRMNPRPSSSAGIAITIRIDPDAHVAQRAGLRSSSPLPRSPPRGGIGAISCPAPPTSSPSRRDDASPSARSDPQMRRLERGSSASRSPSPTKLTPRTSQRDQEAGGQPEPGRAVQDARGAGLDDHVAEARLGRLHAEAEERERRLEQDRVRDAERRDDRSAGRRGSAADGCRRIPRSSTPRTRAAETNSASRSGAAGRGRCAQRWAIPAVR